MCLVAEEYLEVVGESTKCILPYDQPRHQQAAQCLLVVVAGCHWRNEKSGRSVG